MMTWPAGVLVFGLALVRPAPAQTLDYAEVISRTEPVLTTLSGISLWIQSVKPSELTFQYEEGNNLDFWIEEAGLHTARVDSAIRVFRTRPRLIKLVDLVIDGHQLHETILVLSQALSDCHTCNASSAKRAGTWARNSRALQRQLSETLMHLEYAMAPLVVLAEVLAEKGSPESRKK